MQRKPLSANQQKRRDNALAELACLATTIQACNRTLTAVTAEALADRFTREVIQEMIAEGKIKYGQR